MLRRLLLIAALSAPLTRSAVAQVTGGWHLDITPNLWLPSLSGDVKPGPSPILIPVDISIGDILSNLDFGFSGQVEVRTFSYGLAGSVFFLDVGRSEDLGSVITGELDLKLTMWDAFAFYDLGWLDVLGGIRGFAVDAAAGIRLTGLDNGRIRVEGSEGWLDPIAGLRFQSRESATWSFTGLFDVGGFGAGADLTLNGLVLANFRMSRALMLRVGYRVLYTDYEDGVGLQRFVWRMTAQGPMLALTIHL